MESTFEFHSPEEFEDRVKSFLLERMPKLARRSFYVRLHHRGPWSGPQTPDAERLFDDFIVAETNKLGAAARIGFTAPDAIIVRRARSMTAPGSRCDPGGHQAAPPVASGLARLPIKSAPGREKRPFQHVT